jgi:membrane protein DedA with SNARE-associated domain
VIHNLWPYLVVLFAAAVEGEVVYVLAVVDASLGKLNPVAVLLSGSVGGWAGDQLWYYAARFARGPLSSWMNRFEKIARRRKAVRERMHRHATKLILSVRFLPGLRIAIPVACADSGIGAFRFSSLSFVSALAWAAAIMLLVLQLGPTSMSALGIKAWWAPIIPGAIVVLFFRWLSRVEPGEQTPTGPEKP